MPDESVLGGTAGVPILGDLIGANFAQRVKLDAGGDGVSAPVTAATPLPVVQTGTPALPTGASTEATLAGQSAKLPATLGQKAMTASMAVVVASDQSGIPVTLASQPLPTGASTEATLAAASAKLPATLGQRTKAASLAVVLASDSDAMPISGSVTATGSLALPGVGTNAASQVTITSASSTVIAARSGRRGVVITNNQTVAVYIDPSGGTAATTHYRLDPGATLSLPVTTAVTGITSAAYTASGDAKLHVIELY